MESNIRTRHTNTQMPIEDIQYLINHSDADSHLVIVDSANRNKNVHPTPSEFVVQFEESLANVYGIEVLDVSVSSTMYNVEETNNKIKFGQAWYCPDYYQGQINDEAFEDIYFHELLRCDTTKDTINAQSTTHIVIADVDASVSMPIPTTWSGPLNELSDASTNVFVCIKAFLYSFSINAPEYATLQKIVTSSPGTKQDIVTSTDTQYQYTYGTSTYTIPVTHDSFNPQGCVIYVLPDNAIIRPEVLCIEYRTFDALKYTAQTQPTNILLAKRKLFRLSYLTPCFTVNDWETDLMYLRSGNVLYTIDMNTQHAFYSDLASYGTYKVVTLASIASEYTFSFQGVTYRFPIVRRTHSTVDILEFDSLTAHPLSSYDPVQTIASTSAFKYLRVGHAVFELDVRTHTLMVEELTAVASVAQHTGYIEESIDSSANTYSYIWNGNPYTLSVTGGSATRVTVFNIPFQTLPSQLGVFSVYRMDYLSSTTYYDITLPNTYEPSKKTLLTWCPLILSSSCMSLEIGNYDIFGLLSAMNTGFAVGRNVVIPKNTPTGVDLGWGFPLISPLDVVQAYKRNTDGDLTRSGRIVFKAMNGNVRFLLDLVQSTARNLIGFSVVKSVREDLLFRTLKTPAEYQMVMSSLWNGGYVLGPPGVINLTGTRYMVLRCPEIETRIYSSFAYQRFCPGIGLFKLSQNQETVQQRLDFVNFVKKPFHPIGKLQKLTFKFELPDGSFYDFRGIDMFMLLQIKFYAPKKNIDAEATSRLNPNYDPNFMRYMINQSKMLGLVDRADHGGEEDPRYVQLQNNYDYSSEEEYANDEFRDEINIPPHLLLDRGRT